MLPLAEYRYPTRASLGTASLSTSSLFVFSSGAKLDSPLTLPPGRARLATKPAPTGSGKLVITMGMVLVAPILDGNVLSFNPSKLAQLLPECLQADRATGSSGILQETYAGDFPCLLRVCPHPAHRERDD